jgi:hypothetical protein
LPRSSGTYTQPANTAAVANSTASSTAFNTLITDISTALTDSLPVDGTKAMAAALPMGSNKITGLAVGTALTDAASITQVQNRTVAYVDGGGTADAITAAYSPTVTALVDGMELGVRATAANATTTPTFSPDGLTARVIVKGGGSALAAGDIAGDGHDLMLRYDSTNTRWSLLNPFPAAAAGASSATTTLAGVSELATTTEILTGTETANVTATPDSIAALWEQGTTLSSASTLSFGEGGFFHVTGTTTVTDIDFGTTKAGRTIDVVFEGALILTHNATTLILPTGANITTAAGDTCRITSEGGDNVRVINYQRKSGAALSAAASTLTVIKKSGDETVSNSTSLQNDDDFTFSLAANTKYVGTIYLHITEAADATDSGFKFDITGPASPTSVSINAAITSSPAALSMEYKFAEAFSSALTFLVTSGPGDSYGGIVNFYINNGVNAGTFQFRWAQAVADAHNTTLEGSSYMTYQIAS